MKLRSKRLAASLIAVACVASLAACSDGSKESSKAGSTTEPTSSGPVSLKFWGWAPGYKESVAMWNRSHPDTQVTFTEVQPGGGGGYERMLNAVKAGNAPCLAQVGYESLPSFAVEGALEDVTKYAADEESKFVAGAWEQVNVGGKVVGAPLDLGPMAMFYRPDVFKKFGIEVPTTWEEYAAAAEKLHAADPKYHIAAFGNDSYWYSGLNWQAGAAFYGTDGDSWKVGIDSDAAHKVGDYWQDLLTRDLVKKEPTYDTAWYRDLTTGEVATVVDAVWTGGVISANAPDAKGKWAVAPMPQWTAGDSVTGNDGGSSTAVLKGCDHPEQAMEFAAWFATDAASTSNLITEAGIYPASVAGAELPEVQTTPEYFTGDDYWKIFADSIANVAPGWKWGPTMTHASANLSDMLSAVRAAKTTLPEGLAASQDAVVAEMKNKGLKVSE